MKWIKDFIYNKSDLFIALVIVAIAAFVIVSRIEIITAYPSSLTAQANAAAEAKGNGSTSDHVTEGDLPNQDTQGEDPDTPTQNEGSDPDQPVSNDGDTSPSPGMGQQDPGTGDQGSDPNEGSGSQGTAGSQGNSKVSLNIEYGMTGNQIADSLIGAGLLETRQQFFNAVAIAGAETKLQAGTFTIPANASPDEIVSIITK